MLELIRTLFGSSLWEPHGHCFLWSPPLLWTFVVSNLLIALAYFSIPFALLYFVRNRKDLTYKWVFVLFAIFIFGCGTTHVVRVWTIWEPVYWFQGIVDTVTAGASVLTAVLLWPLIPELLVLPSPTQLRVANRELETQIAERRQAEDKFRALLESAPDAMVIVDEAGIIRLVNAQTEEMFGYNREELLGESVEMLIPDRYQRRHVAHRADYNEEPRVRPMGAGMELYGLRADGTEFPVEISLSPIETEAGTLVASAIRDITARKQIEAELRDYRDHLEELVEERTAKLQTANEQLQHEIAARKRMEAKTRRLNEELEERVAERTAQLEATNKELEAFTYSVSHDLRAPLRAMDGFSRILQEDYSDDLPADATRYLDRIRDNTREMGDLIDDLLSFSQFSRQSLQRRAVAPAKLVEEVLDELHAEQHDRHIDIIIEELPVCHADPALLKQVFINLLSNALKYTRKQEEARITVGGQEKENEVVYFVEDNGVGFDMHYASKLFDVFQRLHRVEDYEGTGVGLAIVQRIVHRHGGSVWAEAEVDGGATFYITIPKNKA